MCALVNIHEREGLSSGAYARMQPYTCMYSSHTHIQLYMAISIYTLQSWAAQRPHCISKSNCTFLSVPLDFLLHTAPHLDNWTPPTPLKKYLEEWHFKSCISTVSLQFFNSGIVIDISEAWLCWNTDVVLHFCEMSFFSYVILSVICSIIQGSHL